ncbi:hypothetical protein DPEC_G00221300 [Dallia pectoralis]|uniref:Uncharacterized protein n=1 Tax=Dallia pectoralis TaxID=75939 RepID=A0ACC2G3G8_DALPE|nr:hypothetical protein DPEC_G00221300 [Dallia pectoralis]
MPKSVQKRQSASSLDTCCTPAAVHASDHVYADGISEEDFPSLPVTPSKPPIAKKPTISHVGSASALNSDDAVRTLVNLINSRSDKIEKMVDSVRGEIKVLNEKFYGVPEGEKENVRAEVINICQKVLPEERGKLPDTIDIAHRVGKRQEDSRPRGIIIRFIARRFRDAIWKAAKKNGFLQSKGLRFTEDLTIEDRENRQKLWPKVKKAREEGQAAYFVGGRGFINGVEIIG